MECRKKEIQYRKGEKGISRGTGNVNSKITSVPSLDGKFRLQILCAVTYIWNIKKPNL